MAHPRTWSPDDPFLPELREICLGLPEATEVEAWGRPTFRAGKMPPYWDRAAGWRSTSRRPQWRDEVAELLEGSYRQVAVKRTVKALDARADGGR